MMQLPDKSQRLEELAIKQSRQLIPMTSSMPKPLVLRVTMLFPFYESRFHLVNFNLIVKFLVCLVTS